jgi:hypothetical protein
MILGVLLSAMFAGGLGSLILFVMDAPLWMILMAYPAVGTTVLMSTVWVLATVRRYRPEQPAPHQYPVPRSTTPTVATSTLRSVANDNRR